MHEPTESTIAISMRRRLRFTSKPKCLGSHPACSFNFPIESFHAKTCDSFHTSVPGPAISYPSM
ncbi:hypothetical protein B0H34DRAFT_374043 [Crassisporium funariophilum]|nr:hypothetical protein B0H34DRAFT_374043 [Crassisporium funariophilum]